MELLLRQLLSAVGLQARRPVLAHFLHLHSRLFGFAARGLQPAHHPKQHSERLLGPLYGPHYGYYNPMQRLECRGWRRRLRCAAKAGLGPDDNPAEMASDVLKTAVEDGSTTWIHFGT